MHSRSPGHGLEERRLDDAEAHLAESSGPLELPHTTRRQEITQATPTAATSTTVLQHSDEKSPLSPDGKVAEPVYVVFEDDDPENPFCWSRRKKWLITCLGTWMGLLGALPGPGFVMGLAGMEKDLGTSGFLAALSFSLYLLGFAIGPLVLAPVSEIYGRNPVYIVSSALFTLTFLPMALASNITLVCVFRFIMGVVGSVTNTMVGGTIADMWLAKERGRPMAIFSIGSFSGSGLGLAIFGFVAQYLGWRWMQWIQMILTGATLILQVLFLKETRGSVILSKRAARLRRKTGNPNILCKADEERASLSVVIKTGISRPLWFLLTEPIVISLSIWVGFAWGCLFGLTQAIGLVFRNIYGWETGTVGLAFIPIFLGGMLGWIGNFWQEDMYRKHQPNHGIEARLFGSMVGGVLFGVGSMIFAWSMKGHWIGPLLGIGIMMSGMYCIYQGVFVYLADAYTIYASSALSAQSFSRNLQGFIFPLFTPQMYNHLGYSWAAFLLSMIAFALSVIPFVLFKYGRLIRSKSPAALELARQLEESERTKTRGGAVQV